jgi:ubiquinone/menaquinone biosynthesis C-methylase UbiE
MGSQDQKINANYEDHYAKRSASKVYPTEFVVRTFLASYAGLNFRKPLPGERVLDVGFGDGRNTTFLCDQGFEVAGIEITQGIVDMTRHRLERLGQRADLRVGRNSQIPFDDDHFDYILACHSCYYCDDGESFADNLREYARVLKSGGYLVASVASRASYIFKDAIENPDGSLTVTSDPYGNRNGYRLHAFSDANALERFFSGFFRNFSLGYASNDYYGMSEQVFWVVCQKG